MLGVGILNMGKLKDIVFGKKKEEAPVSKYATSQEVSVETASLRADMEVLGKRLAAVQNENNREKRERTMGAISAVLKRSVPKGIKNPDDAVRNAHLYVGGPLNRGKTSGKKVRLF